MLMKCERAPSLNHAKVFAQSMRIKITECYHAYLKTLKFDCKFSIHCHNVWLSLLCCYFAWYVVSIFVKLNARASFIDWASLEKLSRP